MIDTERPRLPIPDPEEQPWLTIPEAGALFGRSRAAAYQAARRGELPTVLIAGRRVVPVAQLRAMLGMS